MRWLQVALVCAILVCAATTGQATLVTQTYQFTGADLMNYVFVNGADNSTAAGNSLFDGARLRRDGTSGTGPLASRSYWGSQNGAFGTWANSTTDRFLDFNLWGFNGNGANWGEDYKPHSWDAQGSSAGWTAYQSNWPAGWGPPPAGYHTDAMIGWSANTYGDGMNFGDAGLASTIFTFDVTFDTTDMWWGQNTNGAPNSLAGPKTFWFGGYFDNDYFESGNDYYLYEGNLVLSPVPEPTTAALLGCLALAGAGIQFMRRRRQVAARS